MARLKQKIISINQYYMINSSDKSGKSITAFVMSSGYVYS
ncbi:hypothetical protein EJK55_0400 [Moraxella catarrhalis]|uniref:Uncharacterized protein n=1 Tax=Moraxella catarrhalis TaxID=480 RepID=A0A3Q9GC18_MORCA|nr:hypothetical protein EJK53_0730 [Moraxella catarrhalis]RUO13578.1 hypothetical protein EJK54_0344 [Moraxella catarrhalis]RUO15342.1 hypothetical protein EJK55_0400 [Moraxella catarrhalis]